MTLFAYKAVDRAGRVIAGEREALDEHAVLRWLQSQELLPLRAAPRRQSRLGPLLGRSDRLGGRTRALLTRQLATLVGAGLPLDHCLALLARRDAGSGQDAMLARILERVRGGEA